MNCAQSSARWSRRRPFSERDDVDVERVVDWVHVIVGIHVPASAHSVLEEACRADGEKEGHGPKASRNPEGVQEQ